MIRRLAMSLGLLLASACGDAQAPAKADAEVPDTTGADTRGAKAPPAPRHEPPPPMRVKEKGKLLFETQSEFSKIRVRQTGSRRSLFFVQDNGTEWPQTILDVKQPHRPAMPYLRYAFMGLVHRPDPGRALIVGLGGGAMVSILRHASPRTRITAVELDPAVVAVASEWFGVSPNETTDIIAGDGIEFVREATDQKWDIIFMDAFLEPSAKGTDSSGVPQASRTVEWLTILASRLSTDGVVVFNLHNKSAMAKHMEAIRAVFPHVVTYPAARTGNRIVVTSLSPHPSHAELTARAEALKGSPAGPLKLDAILAEHAPIDEKPLNEPAG